MPIGDGVGRWSGVGEIGFARIERGAFRSGVVQTTNPHSFRPRNRPVKTKQSHRILSQLPNSNRHGLKQPPGCGRAVHGRAVVVSTGSCRTVSPYDARRTATSEAKPPTTREGLSVPLPRPGLVRAPQGPITCLDTRNSFLDLSYVERLRLPHLDRNPTLVLRSR